MDSPPNKEITQQAYFQLLQELNESRQRERTINKCYEDLLEEETDRRGSPNKETLEKFQSQHIQHRQEVSDLKSEHAALILKQEQVIHDLKLENKNQGIELQRQKVVSDRKELEMLQKVQEVENQKLNLEHSLQALREDYKSGKDLRNQQLELKLTEAQNELELLKEQNQNDMIEAQLNAEKTLMEMKTMFYDEKQRLNNTIQELRQRQSEQLNSMDIESDSNYEKDYREYCEDLQHQLNSMGSSMMEKKRTNEILEIENRKLHEKLQSKRTKAIQYKLKANKSSETEESLKKEIKYLIGKLMKAKSKLLEDGDFLSQTLGSPGSLRIPTVPGSPFSKGQDSARLSPFRTRSMTKSLTPKSAFKAGSLAGTFANLHDLNN